MLINRLKTLFAIPDTSPSLAMAQLLALKQQVPLLYLILTINGATLAYTHYGLAPNPLVVPPVLGLSAICVVRAIAWVRLDLGAIPQDRYVPLLRRTNRLTAMLSPSFLVWALCLARYGDDMSRMHVFFFLALTPIGCIFCLMHLRSAALIVALFVIVPDIVFVLNLKQTVLTSIAINLLLVGGVMLVILFSQYRSFVRLATQNELLATLGNENLHLASTDALTGLPNRRSFFPALDTTVDRSRTSGSAFLLGIIDLDGFKSINDTYGHPAGDEVLAEAAARLRDIVPSGAVLARLGGDEFALIVAETSALGLDRLSQDILAAIAPSFACAGASVRIGASIGFARTRPGISAARMIEQADFALYEAKAGSRRGTWVLFDDEHEARMRLQRSVENALHQADLMAELSLLYQPMVDVTRQRTTGFEALARWDSPALGRVPPDRFITIAERTGMICDITIVLLAKAIEQLRTWPDGVTLSFNLSMVDITTPDAVARICEMVQCSGVAPACIQFEVTETAMLGDFEQARAGLSQLKALGVQLALDDFGTGYSSLTHLHRLPVDKLKIDQSFTSVLSTSSTARSIVASTLALARNLGLDCVVEGVETQEQLIVLRSYGGRIMQGYLFRKPMPADEIAGHLSAEASRRAEAPAKILTTAAAILKRGSMDRSPGGRIPEPPSDPDGEADRQAPI